MKNNENQFQDISSQDDRDAEYYNFIKESVKDGSYFKDAVSWYCFRYLAPLNQRTILLFTAILCTLVTYILIDIIIKSFPIVRQVPIIVSSADQATYFSKLTILKSKEDKGAKTLDEAVARYLVKNYVIKREGFDFRSRDPDTVYKKLRFIRNNSSSVVNSEFEAILSKDNPNSPIKFFGKSVRKTVEIESFRFVQKNNSRSKTASSILKDASNFITGEIPTDAEVKFSTTMISGDVRERNTFLAKITFEFGGYKEDGNLRFSVNSYKLYKVSGKK